ncbi:flagellar hook-associated protein FlgK [Paramaledivibacter caminithermalis]|jgi:flagellar hook-associated protein 1 FlgK|uniref:Flagellar hook-associated protein 1 n=1 Tax=Paramaledivibacter caminithermalis (strain DSM 15212 / CIP 107654 / DViRD3) TaxID=1121301 RepID=A0A1M6L5I2_PARC5|nr:flagellar hook-associated protein FlgK [Paramaledivibacter caminithermalis]SHJ66463.1 flagellar hook-associated protein 1 FlgK [Paramaledivibacter caminithermalis DSM 15212]
MSSTFFGFNIARSGLFASQRALNITSHNIANVNTEGYCRQRLDIKQTTPMLLPNGQGMLGTGVMTENVTQIRHEFLDFKYRGENKTFGEWEAKFNTLDNIQGIFNEPSDSGIQTVLDQFFSSLHELSKTPENLTTRALVRERAIALTTSLNHMAGQFEKLQSDTDFEIRTTADEINGYSEQITKLNKLIYNAELDGSKANDLRDQRNLLVDKLSKLVNVDYYEDNQNRFHVLINGKTLVSHFRNNKLKYEERENKLNPSCDVTKLHDIKWEDGSTFNPTSGKIKGLMDMRDNISGDNKGIPYYMEKLNEFADGFAEVLNTIHKAGYGLEGDTDIYLFTINGMSTADYKDYLLNKGLDGGPAEEIVGVTNMNDAKTSLQSKISADPAKYRYKTVKEIDGKFYIVDRISASELTVSGDIQDSEKGLNKIAASTEDNPELPGNGDNALAMVDVRHDVDLFEWGSPEDFVKSLISNLGVDTQSAERMRDNQIVLLKQVETNRQSISGVSIDEEMSNMIRFQHSFNANSRMITAMDEMIETIISRMGLVGR